LNAPGVHRSRKGGNPLTKLHIERWRFLARASAPVRALQFRIAQVSRPSSDLAAVAKAASDAIRATFGILCLAQVVLELRYCVTPYLTVIQYLSRTDGNTLFSIIAEDYG